MLLLNNTVFCLSVLYSILLFWKNDCTARCNAGWETIRNTVKRCLPEYSKREPLGADVRQTGTGAGGILSARRVKPVVCD
jgi:hypothetical protein